jgi:putative PIN family toxin of toxin-antitoxin system
MKKAVYDTNVLASGTVSVYGPNALLVDAWINNTVSLITSEPLLDELHRTLTKPYFTDRLSPEQRATILTLIKTRATVISISTPIPHVATHPEDEIVLATAESGKAEYIVTGDHGLQSVKKFKGITIVSPREFAALLEQDKSA